MVRVSVPERGRARVHLDGCRVVFQAFPGPGTTGIAGLRVRAGGALLTTTSGGSFSVPLVGGTALLELLAPTGDAAVASFFVTARAGLPAAPAEGAADSLHDVRVALNHLGYDAGREAASSDALDPPDADLERATLCFEADEGRRCPEGITSRIQQSHFERAVHLRVAPHTRDRLRAWLQADLNGLDRPEGDAAPGGEPPPASDEVVAGGCGPSAGSMPRTLATLGRHRLVLVRFTRDASAPATTTVDGVVGPNHLAPYVDECFAADAGYAEGHRGPLVSVTEPAASETYQVRLVRQNLVDDAPLYVASCDEAAVTSPGEVPAGGSAVVRFDVQPGAARGADHRVVDLEVKLGGPTGPTLHVLRVVVLRPVDVPVAVIGVRHARSGEDFVTNARVRDAFARCNRLFCQAGVRLVFDGEVDYRHDDSYDYAAADDEGRALDRMLTVLHHPDRLNVYVSNHVAFFAASSFLAIGQSTATGSELTAVFCQPEAFAASTTVPHVLGHELGHALGLVHPDRDDPDDRDEWQRVTAWTLRRLMFYRTNAPRLPDWHEFGGGAAAGNFLTVRNLGVDGLDDEVRRLRDRIARGAGSGGVYDGHSAGS